jgi:hypothetical protein
MEQDDLIIPGPIPERMLSDLGMRLERGLRPKCLNISFRVNTLGVFDPLE